MNMKKKLVAGACATALCSMMAAPAFAATVGSEGGTAEVPIYATVVPAGGGDVISVVMPAQIPLNIYLDADGKLDMSTGKTEAVSVQVQNMAASTKSVKVTLDSVTDTGKLMSQVKLDINGKDLSTSAQGTELIGSIAPGESESLTLTPAKVSEQAVSLNGTYTVSTVVKANAV